MNRRDILKLGLSSAVVLGLPSFLKDYKPGELPDKDLFLQNEDEYWTKIRDEFFLLPKERIFLNTGSLGVAPKPVIKAIYDYLNLSASLELNEYPRWGYETLDDFRTELSQFFRCKKDELALTHNVTEGMNIVANGLDLKLGDEVLSTDQEHPGGSCCWLQKQARFGISYRKVVLPIPPKSQSEITDLIISSIGPKTKVLSFSGILSPNGLILPIRDICKAARDKGVITVVDGAHVNGQIPVSFSDLGCDFFAGSPHKWMLTPAGCGFLYIREELLDKLWVNVASSNWDNRSLKAARFMMVGTNNLAIFKGFASALKFIKEIRPEKIYQRIHQLSQSVYKSAVNLPRVEMITPEDDKFYGGIVTFKIKDADLKPVWELCKKRRIWMLEGERIRISTHIHTRPEDINALFDTIREGLRL